MASHLRSVSPPARAGLLGLIFGLGLGFGALAQDGPAYLNEDAFLPHEYPAPETQPRLDSPRQAVRTDDAGWQAVILQLENAQAQVQTTRENLVSARAQLTRARTRRYPRGPALVAIEDRAALASKRFQESETNFVMLVQHARRAGLPAGLLSPFLDFAQEIQRETEVSS